MIEEITKDIMSFQERSYDNLFNATHRAIMIKQHGGTAAQIIKLENLNFLKDPFVTTDETQKQWLP